MAYLQNRTVNLLNLHYVINAIAFNGGGAFFLAYLLKSGMSSANVMFGLAAIFVGRLTMRVVLLPLAKRTGLRFVVMIGVVLMSTIFPILAEVHGLDTAFYLLIVAASFSDTIYWPSYHAYFAALGDEDHRGHQLGMREAVAALTGIASPLITGWLLVAFGPRHAFYATAAIQALSAIPLFWTPDVVVPRTAPGAFRDAMPGMALFVADGWLAAGFAMVWQAALFITLGRSFIAFGGALAISALVGAVGSLVLGRLIDSGKGTRAVWYGVASMALLIAFRAYSDGNPTLAVAATALGSLVACLYVPVLMTAVYNQAKQTSCTLRFHIASEGGWDVGGLSGCVFAGLIAQAGLPLSYAVGSALLGAGAVFILLYRYYAAHGNETVVVGELQVLPADAPKI